MAALHALPAASEVTLGPPDAALIAALRDPSGSDHLIPVQVLRITGEITSADTEVVAEVLEELRPELEYQEEVRPLLAVLDSPGGFFAAGIDIARLFDSVAVPTFVPPGGSCLSACAVIFMSGTWRSMGGEGGETPARMVALPSELGFHRPFLLEFVTTITPGVLAEPPEEIAAFFDEEYRTAFDKANQLIQDMLAVDSDAWNTDLLLRMLTATERSGNGAFVRLETVQDALTWEIDVVNVRVPATESYRERFDVAFALCFNGGPTVASSVDRYWPAPDALDREYEFNRSEVPGMYPRTRDVTGRRIEIFIHHEAPMGCEVTFSSNTVHVSFGQFEDGDPVRKFDLESPAGRLWGHHPYTPLDQIAVPVPEGDGYRCMVLAGVRVDDDDECRLESRMTREGELVDTFTWPSGARTVITSHGVRQRLNDADTIPVTQLPAGVSLCLKSDKTGRTFCYGLR